MQIARFSVVLALVALLGGCASIVKSATQNLATNLSQAILNQNDTATVRDGAPSYLIMVDSFIASSPDDGSLLRAASALYGAYASAFAKEQERRQRLAQKAYDYAHRAFCLELESLCEVEKFKLEQLQHELAGVPAQHQPVLYDFTRAWAGWIQANSGDWNALAQIPRLQALFTRSVQLDEGYDHGGAHLYLGVLASQIPPALGGKPEVGRAHFEQAIALSGGNNQMASVLFAEHYARLVFDQELHDRLLRQVLEPAEPVPGLVLINALARERAAQLLEESPEYF
jgi:uncharacterized protein YceK